MASIVFIAVQCCECSTMQVKQKKKSSNKWVCAVCNQKQSVRKIFAQSYMAKDIRKFVQSSNMLRSSSDGGDYQTLTQITVPIESAGQPEDQQRKRRFDWSQYLDYEEDDGNKGKLKEEGEQGDDLGLKTVTEWPKKMFKKRQNGFGSETDAGDGSHELYKPVFSKRESKRQLVEREENKVTLQKTSKLNAYIAHDEDNFKVANGRNFADETDNFWETTFDEHKVEDDIHPDFI